MCYWDGLLVDGHPLGEFLEPVEDEITESSRLSAQPPPWATPSVALAMPCPSSAWRSTAPMGPSWVDAFEPLTAMNLVAGGRLVGQNDLE